MMVAECMECSAATATSRSGPVARLYREAPLNGIWEGSGNVICLDVLRAMQKTRRRAMRSSASSAPASSATAACRATWT